MNNYRDHGGIVFIDLRDRDGLTQIAFDPSTADIHALAGTVRTEWCIGISGVVKSRGGNVNEKMPTGAIEVWADELEVFSKAETPPFAPLLTLLSDSYLQLGKNLSALEQFDLLLTLEPGRRLHLKKKANLLKHMKRYDEALQVYAALPGPTDLTSRPPTTPPAKKPSDCSVL